MKGFFIALEGGDGAGKTTQAARLAERLRAAGRTVTITREPGGTARGEALRGLLLMGDLPWEPIEEMLLMTLARRAHWREKIKPALARGEIVLCDRFVDSTRAYQGASGVGRARIDEAHEDLVGAEPDLVLVLDVAPETALARMAARGMADRFEARGTDFLRKARKIFKDLVEEDPERRVLIEAGGKEEAVAEEIWRAVMTHPEFS